ncbi:MAG: glycerol-3-phosphate acyltransferase [Actinobacteria bacterium]|nr:glycerol-3-phosphate acyltransferase [Actinomycetota bacterium]
MPLTTLATGATVEFIDIVVVIVAYLLGTFPSAELIASRYGKEITKVGSGNPGASNVIRELGWKAGMSVFLMDMAKAAIAVGIAWAVSGDQRGPLSYAAMCSAIVGHVAPVFRKFRGGKGVASAGGAMFVLFPVVSAVLFMSWFVISKITRKASVASLAITVATPVGMLIDGAETWELLVVLGVVAFVIIKHLPNIRRLKSKTEPSL